MGGADEALATGTDARPLHVPVMAGLAAKALLAERDGCYVDATFGRGGHAARLLAQLAPEAKLLALDRDAAAVAAAGELAERDPRVFVRHGAFADLHSHLGALDFDAPAGVLFDVGVSSPQLDDPQRGFSFAADGPLDMRMDQRQKPTAAQWLNAAAERDIEAVIRSYGEEHYARRLARAVVRARPLATTTQLAKVVAATIPGLGSAPSVQARVFQAVRIHINDELTQLASGLDAAFAALKTGGRLVVVTFHGLEHRLVRRRFRSWVEGEQLPSRLPLPEQPRLARRIPCVGKGLRPSEAEVAANPRCRSALLQVVEKIAPRPEARA